MRYEKEDILDEQFPEGYGHSPFSHPLGFDAPYATHLGMPEDYDGAPDDDEEYEEDRGPEPWEEQVRLWGMYPNE